MDKKKEDSKVLQTNKKAYFNYEIIEDLEAGISLEGTEVKSMRMGRFSFTDSYCKIENGYK
ncbi:MAG: SsrA-binding protein, partial [Sphaerochaetaceae bacterium]|nr:SsrA-binding protein [Sphaerochaetaceae bacterium]